jgi:curved DNA-binding protein CbpA
MQLSPNADADTIQRVYRILAQRYHPDSAGTGDKEIFLRLCEAHRILIDPQLRAKYDARYRETKQLHWKIFDRAEAAKGPEAEQRKRRGILELLYAKTAQNPERATMTVFEFEQLLGCPREHLEFALWYLRGKGYVTRGDNGRFTLTVPGSDEVESPAQSWDHRNQKLLEPGAAGPRIDVSSDS